MIIKDYKYKESRTKIGNFMYILLTILIKPLIKHRWLYWLLNFTWGILTTLCGLLISLTMIIVNHKPQKWCSVWYFEIAKNWGGMEMGTMFLRDKTSYYTINNHEMGHTYQNAVLGPFFIFLVALPSAVRYWYRRLKRNRVIKPYDLIWFEGNATDIGNYIYEYDTSEKGERK